MNSEIKDVFKFRVNGELLSKFTGKDIILLGRVLKVREFSISYSTNNSFFRYIIGLREGHIIEKRKQFCHYFPMSVSNWFVILSVE